MSDSDEVQAEQDRKLKRKAKKQKHQDVEADDTPIETVKRKKTKKDISRDDNGDDIPGDTAVAESAPNLKKRKKSKEREANGDAAVDELLQDFEAVKQKEDEVQTVTKKRARVSDPQPEQNPAANNDSYGNDEQPLETNADDDVRAAESKADHSADDRRIFCGNLSFKIDEETLKAVFKSSGVIESIQWLTDKETGKFYGSAFIQFQSAKAAKKALENNGMNVMGRPMKLGSAMMPTAAKKQQVAGSFKGKGPKPEGCTTVFLGNLSYEIDENELSRAFEHCGEIKDIRWVMQNDEFRGCGFIEFADTEAVDEAVKMSGAEILGRRVKVDYAARNSREDSNLEEF